MNLVYAIIYGVLGQILSFIVIQGSYKIPLLKNHMWIPLTMGIGVSFFIIKSVKYFIDAFDGQIWPSRILGFSIGIVIFAIMGWLMFGEKITIKTFVCLMLCAVIMMIQIFWKTPNV